MKLPDKIKIIIFQLSAILILSAAVLYTFDPDVAKYTMIIGVAGYAATTFTTPYPGKSIRGKRMFNIMIFAVLLMAVAAYLMFAGMKQWIICLFIAAVLTLYGSIMLPRIYKKEQEENNNDKSSCKKS